MQVITDLLQMDEKDRWMKKKGGGVIAVGICGQLAR
jgi:hypothetical protein